MKKIFFFAMLLIIATTTFSQQTNPSPALTKQDYLKKSKNQKTAAWILLGGGAALTAGSIVWGSQNIFSTSSGPIVLFVAGGVAMIGSIPLFIASSKNKKRAMNVLFKTETAPQIQKNSFVYRTFPSLSLKINL